MTNFGTRLILGLPKMPERQLRVLLALETLPRRKGGWRRAGTELLAATAGLSANTAVKARDELVSSGAIEYRRGNGRGKVSAYRIKVTNDVGYLSSAERYPNGLRKGTQTGSVKVPKRNAPSSGNASGELSTYELQSSAHLRGVAEIIRKVFPDATDDEIEIIGKDRTKRGARSVAAVLPGEIERGELRLPCDGYRVEARHTQACIDGNSGGCAYDTYDWCVCRCHTRPAEADKGSSDEEASDECPPWL